MKKSILFVDDQPNVLSGLRRMLHTHRIEWDMEFLTSAEEALVRMDQIKVDVVVTDMRMPGMNGAALLNQVRERHPDTVRIILSGQSDQEAILRSIGATHQYLSKPCDAETLTSTVTRACALRDRLADNSIKGLVSRVTTLPSLPKIYHDLVQELQSPDSSIQRVGDLIAKDMAMTAKVLQLVNSSFFGLPRRVTSPTHAATMLGVNLLKPLVLSAGVFAQFKESDVLDLSLSTLQDHSLAVGLAAQRIARSETDDKTSIEDAMLAGVLHDVGKLVLAANLRQRYGEVLALAHERGTPLWQVERECLGATHADVGGYLLGLWGLPNPIVEAVTFHHTPSQCLAKGYSSLAAVHVANALRHADQSEAEAPLVSAVDQGFLEQAGLANRLEKWESLACEAVAAGA